MKREETRGGGVTGGIRYSIVKGRVGGSVCRLGSFTFSSFYQHMLREAVRSRPMYSENSEVKGNALYTCVVPALPCASSIPMFQSTLQLKFMWLTTHKLRKNVTR